MPALKVLNLHKASVQIKSVCFISMALLSIWACEWNARTFPSPDQRQSNWQTHEIEGLVHFGVNAFTWKDWGSGTENPSIFAPSGFDPEQWVDTAKSFGAKALILVAKHDDGFCLWPSAFTEHSVKNSSWRDGKGDVVREVAEACRRGGIKFGVYLSPSDRNHPSYGRDSEAYNDYFCNQLRELLTNYGPISQVFFDGASAVNRKHISQRK